MKQLYTYLLFLPLLVLGVSCMNLQEMNIDKNKPSETDPQLLLTNVEWKACSESSRDAMFASRYLVATDGTNSIQAHNWNRGDYDYELKMLDITKMMEEAPKSPAAKGYLALGHFFRANYYYKLALTFGDVPYIDAIKGESNDIHSPAYSTQKDVFTGILQELKAANDSLALESNVIKGDIIYNGNADLWRKAVNAMRLKVLITLSRRQADAGIDLAAEFASIVNSAPLFSSIAENCQLLYIDQAGIRYPFFNSSNFGSATYMDSTFVALLSLRKDPRLITFATQTKKAEEAALPLDDYTSYGGGNPIVPYTENINKAGRGEISRVNTRFYQDPTNEPQIMIGYSEQELIIAEAIVRGWVTGNAQDHYESAIRGSFAFYKKYASQYASYFDNVDQYIAQPLVNWSNATTPDQQIALIATQRYIPSFFQGMWTPYFEQLRTGYPNFLNAVGSPTAYRWMYPSEEFTTNATNVQAAIMSQFGGNDAITEQTWWIK